MLLLPSARQGRHVAVVMGSLDRLLVGATAAAGLLALLLTWLLERGILAPVRQLQEATRNLESGRLESRVSIQGCDELAELSRGFNGMAAELERQQGRSFTEQQKAVFRKRGEHRVRGLAKSKRETGCDERIRRLK